MAEAIQWHGANKLLNPPKGRESSFQALPVFNNGTATVSCWKLSPEELAEVVQNGGHIFVCIIGGPSQMPMHVGIEENIRAMMIDTGPVWSKII